MVKRRINKRPLVILNSRKIKKLPRIRIIRRKVNKQSMKIKTSNPYRTISQIENSLAKGMRGMSMKQSGHSFAKCVADPFSSGATSGIPDGNNEHFVVADDYCYCDISDAASNGIVLQTLPSLPCLGMVTCIKPLGSLVVSTNGAGSVNYTAPNSLATQQKQGWYPALVPNTYAGSYSAGSSYVDPYSSATLRFISFGYKIVYTGTANSCSGTITVNGSPVAWKTGGIQNNATNVPVPNTIGVLPLLPTQSPFTLYGVDTPITFMDFNFSPAAFNKNSVILRPESGCYVVPKRKTNTYSMLTTPTAPSIQVANVASGAPAAGAIFGSLLTTSDLAGAFLEDLICFDNDFEAHQIIISGYQPNSSFRIYAVVCSEYNPVTSSTIYKFSKEKSDDRPSEMKQAKQEKDVAPDVSPLAGGRTQKQD